MGQGLGQGRHIHVEARQGTIFGNLPKGFAHLRVIDQGVVAPVGIDRSLQERQLRAHHRRLGIEDSGIEGSLPIPIDLLERDAPVGGVFGPVRILQAFAQAALGLGGIGNGHHDHQV